MNTELRRKDRAVTDPAEIRDLVDRAKILHLGLYDGAYPYVVPLHFGYECSEGVYTFYMHGAKAGHKLDLIRAHPRVCVELEWGVVPVSGGDRPEKYSSLYASFIGRGIASIVEDPQEQRHGLDLLMKNQTGREFLFPEPLLASTAVIKVDILSYTAKAKKTP